MIYFWKADDTRMSEIKFLCATGTTGTSGTRYLKSVAGVSISPFSILTIGVIFSILSIGVIYFWKGGDTRMSEIKFSGTKR